MSNDFSPGSFGAHEALHTTSVVMDMLDRHVLQHPAVAGRAKWLALAAEAHQKLFDLYQAIGAEHLADETPAKPFDREEAVAKALKNIEEMTDEEDAAITADAQADPDNPPADDLMRRRGRTR